MTKVEVDNYKNALVEVEAVLNCLEFDEYKKIPNNIIQSIQENKNDDYEFNYDENLEYDKWDISTEAKALLYNIYKKYIANEEEKSYFKDKERFEIMQIEKEKSMKYNKKEIFKNSNQMEKGNISNQENNSLIQLEKEKWYTRILNKLKKLFKRI